MFSTRILPPAEWPRLAGTEAASVWPRLDPALASVLVVEDEHGAIVGSWLLLRVLMAECLWIDPAHRGKGSVARRLWAFMRRTAQSMGFAVVGTAAMSEDVRNLLAHVGATKIPGDVYTLGVN